MIFRKTGVPSADTSVSGVTLSAQEFINVRDIIGGKLYTKDGYVFMYLKITHISIDLKSANEKLQLARNLAAELSGDREAFQIIAVSRPLDLTPIINELNEYSKKAEEAERKEVIRLEKKDIRRHMLDDSAVSRQFYLAIWAKDEPDSPISRRAYEMKEHFRNVQINAELMSDTEIVQLCHVLTNPESVQSSDDDFVPSCATVS